jgi:hypothetical protein
MPDVDHQYPSPLNHPINTDTASEGWVPDEDFLSEMEDYDIPGDKPRKSHHARFNTDRY